ALDAADRAHGQKRTCGGCRLRAERETSAASQGTAGGIGRRGSKRSMNFLIGFACTFLACFIVVPLLLLLARFLALYVVVQEQQCVVFELFGRVRQVINTPGLLTPWTSMGPLAI